MSALVAWVLLVLGALIPFLIMASDRVWSFGVELGFLGVLACSIGLVRLVRREPAKSAADTANSAAQPPVVVRTSWRPLILWLASSTALWAVLYLAVAGVYPAQPFVAGTLVTLAFIAWVAASFTLGRALGVWATEKSEQERALLERHGFWLLVIGSLLYLPMLGNFALLDPWETHYGEVAREILARDDWISLWWAQDGWFWSKPVLTFWIQSLSFKVFGVNYMPDQMVAGVLAGRWPQPEWAARWPVFLMTLLSVHVLYRACVRPFGRRAAFLGGLVLLTCPYWVILARQTMTDMPYVAPMTAALAFLMLGLQTKPDALVRDYRVSLGRWNFRFNAFQLLFCAILVCALPQILYLLTRQVTLHLGDPFGFRPHLDEFMRGSGGGNCGQPGNKSCGAAGVRVAWGHPALAALVWMLLGGLLLFLNRRERRVQRLYFLAGWFCTALAALGKGAPGLVIPLATALVFVVVTGRFRDLLRLEFPALLLLTAIVTLPWYVQMYMRHGYAFIDRLIFHDMVKRAFKHVHDTNKGDDTSFRYYIWQLGYGLFPWTGLAAGGLMWWGRRGQRVKDQHSNAALYLMTWFLITFGMFSVTGTKFHHYILPLVPPTAMLTGCLLARYVPKRLPDGWGRTAAYYGGMLAGTGGLYFGILSFFPGSVAGLTWDGELAPAKLWLGVLLLLGATGCMVFVARRFGVTEPAVEGRSALAEERARYLSAVLGAVAIAAAVAVFLAGRDMFTTNKGDLDGPIRLLHLVTYNYDRPWPEVLDFRPALLAFTILGAGLCALLAVHPVRRHLGVVFCGAAFWWTVWVCDVYLVQIAPHWSQRATMIEYLKQRQGPNEFLVAYQMNWKGENFYTGNRMATYVSTGKKFKDWIAKQRKKGVTTMFFTTEHSRINSLKRELNRPKDFELLTTEADNNKFVLARVHFSGPIEDDE